MKNRSQTIRKIVGYLNNPEEDGGFWLPDIQRPFVCGEEHFCSLDNFAAAHKYLIHGKFRSLLVPAAVTEPR